MHPLKTGGKTAWQKVGRRISLGLSAGGMLLIASLLSIHKEIQFHKFKGTERDSFFIWESANSNHTA